MSIYLRELKVLPTSGSDNSVPVRPVPALSVPACPDPACPIPACPDLVCHDLACPAQFALLSSCCSAGPVPACSAKLARLRWFGALGLGALGVLLGTSVCRSVFKAG